MPEEKIRRRNLKYQILPEITGLVEFSGRVLSNGNPTADINNEDDLERLLISNQFFLSGIEELFTKRFNEILPSTLGRIMNLYDIYLDNLWKITRRMMVWSPWHLDVNGSVEYDLTCRTLVEKDIELVGFLGEDGKLKNRLLKNGRVYYAGWQKTSMGQKLAIWTVINPPTYMGFTADGLRVYWKREDCVRRVMEARGMAGCCACKFTMDVNDNVLKCEFNGDAAVANSLMAHINPDAVIVPNPFLSVDDLIEIVRKENPHKTEMIQLRENLETVPFEDDRLIEYPVESFGESIRFLMDAAASDLTRSIFITVYRIGMDPTLYYVLRDAVRRGIYVHANIEICASEEGINLFWMKKFLRAGIHATAYECGSLKVHAKVILVDRSGRWVCQVGTGNYHTKTTTQYTDLAVVMSDQSVCNGLRRMFDLFDGENIDGFGDDLMVSKHNMRERMMELIRREGMLGTGGLIIFKCNAIDDPQIIAALNRAASNGCRVELIVRGNCSWYPSPTLLNNNVRIRSFVWEKLEHSRVYVFGYRNPAIYVGSADMVSRKLDKRIEILAEVKNPAVREDLKKYVERYVNSTENSWRMFYGTNDGPRYLKESG